MLGIRDGTVADVAFTGRGCAISQACASLLTDEIKGKPVDEVAQLTSQDVLDLLGIEISPARLKCALLSLDTLEHALAEADGEDRSSAHRRSRLTHDAQRPIPSMLREARWSIREVSPAEAELIQQTQPDAVVVDVRETVEWDEGHIPGAVHVPRGYLESRDRGGRARPRHAGRPLLRRRRPLGARREDARARWATPNVDSHDAAASRPWKSQGLRWTTPPKLTAEQKSRYSRHLLIPEVGAEGPGEAARLEGAAHRRRRPRLAGGALPRRGGRRHDRHRRLRHRRPVEPPAPGHPHRRTGSGRRRSTRRARRSRRSTPT